MFLKYKMLPAARKFHENKDRIRILTGEETTGKTHAAIYEACFLAPMYLFGKYGFRETRWLFGRQNYCDVLNCLIPAVKNIVEKSGTFDALRTEMVINFQNGIESRIFFTGFNMGNCNIRSLSLTGYFIDNSEEVDESIKQILRRRIIYYPKRSNFGGFGIEVTTQTNESEGFSIFKMGNHENQENLPSSYTEKL